MSKVLAESLAIFAMVMLTAYSWATIYERAGGYTGTDSSGAAMMCTAPN